MSAFSSDGRSAGTARLNCVYGIGQVRRSGLGAGQWNNMRLWLIYLLICLESGICHIGLELWAMHTVQMLVCEKVVGRS